MRNLSLLFLVVIIIMGGASIANDMYNNVLERRKEIGTLVALGGYILGTAMAVILGPFIAGIPVFPIFYLLFTAIGISVFITLIASYFPARYATKLDPCTSLRDI